MVPVTPSTPGLLDVVVTAGYGLLATNVGTITGQPHSVLARGVLGKSGSALASVLLVLTGLGWYGFQAVFLAQLLNGLGMVFRPGAGGRATVDWIAGAG